MNLEGECDVKITESPVYVKDENHMGIQHVVIA